METTLKNTIQKSLAKVAITDLPMPECIRRVVSAIPNTANIPGQVKLDKEGGVLEEYLEFDGLIKPMIQAFDNFLDVQLKRRIEKTEVPFSLGSISFKNVNFMKPTIIDPTCKLSPCEEKTIPLYPYMCRRNRTSYTIAVNATIVFTPKDKSKPIEEINYKVCDLPVMLGSKYCNLNGLNDRELVAKKESQHDPFGYFLIEGAEKVILQHDKLRYNRPFIFQDKSKKSAPSKLEQSVNLNSKKKALNPVICRFTSIPTTELEPSLAEKKVYESGIKFDAKKSTVVNLHYDIQTRALVIRLDKFQADTYLNIFYLFKLFGKDPSVVKNMILHFVKDQNVNTIRTFLDRGEVDFSTNQDLIAVLRQLIRMPEPVEKMGAESQMEFYQEVVSEVLFRQIEGVIYKTKQAKYDAKLQMLSILCARYAEYLNNMRPADSRDSWGNKRIVSAGPAMEHLFNQSWTLVIVGELIQYLSTVTVNQQESFNLKSALSRMSNVISQTFIGSFTPNQWGVKGSIMKENMTDILKNENILAKYSQLLRISPATSDKGRQESIREVNPTQLGYICPIETPEGKQCGIVKGMSIGCYLSIQRDEASVLRYILKILDKAIAMKVGTDYNTAFILNGKFIGWCVGPDMEKKMIDGRRKGLIDKDILVYYEKPKIIWVFCDGGRPTRPLLIVNPETKRLVIDEKNLWGAKFDDLMKAGAVEYIDALEQEYNCVVAQSIWDPVLKVDAMREIAKSVTSQRTTQMYPSYSDLKTPDYTHCEMDPNAILSVVASIIPMPDRSQAPRNTYQVAMGKAALAIQSTNAVNRYDTSLKSLVYAAPAVFKTRMQSYLGLDENPFGQTITVAIMPYGGYNQEDSIIIDKNAVDRGLFRIIRTLTYKSIQLAGNKDYVEIMRKPIKKGIPNINTLDEEGVVLPGTRVSQGDCLIGKVKQYPNGDIVDASTYVGIGDSGIVERVLKTTSTDSQKIVMVKIREVRKPRAGDKFASRYAQKGTVGIVMPTTDMPFISGGPSDGMVPNMIINPLAIPSRMTIGKLIEIMTSKVAVMRGEVVNATAFRAFNLDDYCNSLASYGYDRFGTETMVHGELGHPLESRIFVGPCYYQALKHHVQDKIQVRSRGSVKVTNRQPTAGRTNNGGMRFGEMEKDTLSSHGAFSCLREKTFDHSDAYKAVFCKKCGTIANVSKVNLDTICALCGDKKYGMVSIPYSYKVLSHELTAVSISIRLKLQTKNKEVIG